MSFEDLTLIIPRFFPRGSVANSKAAQIPVT